MYVSQILKITPNTSVRTEYAGPLPVQFLSFLSIIRKRIAKHCQCIAAGCVSSYPLPHWGGGGVSVQGISLQGVFVQVGPLFIEVSVWERVSLFRGSLSRGVFVRKTFLDRDHRWNIGLETETSQKEHWTRHRDSPEGTWDQAARQDVTSFRDPRRQANTCEYVTLPELCLQAVKVSNKATKDSSAKF